MLISKPLRSSFDPSGGLPLEWEILIHPEDLVPPGPPGFETDGIQMAKERKKREKKF